MKQDTIYYYGQNMQGYQNMKHHDIGHQNMKHHGIGNHGPEEEVVTITLQEYNDLKSDADFNDTAASLGAYAFAAFVVYMILR